MDVTALEAEAKAAAIKHVTSMLQMPEQLDKVQQYKKRVSRKKASVEAMLKTALQSQLDGFRTALSLQKSLPKDVLEEVKEESMRHSQYGAAIENLKHIFNVPGSVQKTQELIAQDKLLHAHQALSELENSRDDLLFELHKLPSQSVTDRNMLKQYFADVEKLSEDLGKQIWLVLKRTLNSVRKEPQVVVTALRIIEREERRDQAALERQKSSGGFLPPGRPKQWRKRCFEVLESAVEDRIEGNQFEDRHENKMWLVRHLEVTRQIVLDDLRTVKTVCVPCFPPEYDIVNRYVRMYHSCLSRHLQSIIANELEGNEYITVLGWLTVPCWGGQEVQQLIDKYLGTLVANYQDWLRNALQSDVKDWHRACEPDVDSRGAYHTAAPMIVFQMVDQHLQVAKTVGPDLVRKVLTISLEQTTKFVGSYMEAVTEFRDRHFEDRSVRKCFTHYVIAVANNCLQFQQLFDKSYTDCCTGPGALAKGDNEVSQVYHRLQQSLERLQERTLDTLRDELFLDLNKELADVMTRKWLLTGTNIIDTVSVTMEDYFRDYARLLPQQPRGPGEEGPVGPGPLLRACHPAAKDHLQGASSPGGAAASAPRRGLSSAAPSPLEALPLLAEVLKMKDTSLLSLEVSGLIKRYPGHLGRPPAGSCSLLRGDMSRNEARNPRRRDALRRRPPRRPGNPLHLLRHHAHLGGGRTLARRWQCLVGQPDSLPHGSHLTLVLAVVQSRLSVPRWLSAVMATDNEGLRSIFSDVTLI
ncbi:hypothetical protein HPB48_015352 [Haemaphysalis longicornis]|uniref:Exocyst complex component 3 n=1 Tax=Haemaphysalis longicornis TaxID=44386 RepID=A0A9J6FLU6_HAELO|nr:hypothetical protein HPB48_015352 [Haemaphysalis longicornis]